MKHAFLVVDFPNGFTGVTDYPLEITSTPRYRTVLAYHPLEALEKVRNSTGVSGAAFVMQGIV